MNYLYRLLLRVRPAILTTFIKKILRVRRQVVSTDQGKFFIDPVSIFYSAISSKNGYEPQMTASLQQILKQGDVFIDIGANEGYFSIIASKLVGKSGQVISIEPQSRLQSVLSRNMRENETTNMSVIQNVVSDKVGATTLHLAPDTNT